jgi:hypothetical protein
MEVIRPQRRPRKPAIVFRPITIEEPVRLLLTANPGQAQLLDQPVLKDAELPFDPTLSLGRVGVNDVYPQLFAGPRRRT